MSCKKSCNACGWIVILGLGVLRQATVQALADTAPVVRQNEYARLVLGADGQSVQLTDLCTSEQIARRNQPIAQVKINGDSHPVSAVSSQAGRVKLAFGSTGATAALEIDARPRYFVFEVAEVEGSGIEELTFIDLQLKPREVSEDDLVGCTLALNLQTKVLEIPQPMDRLRAMCYPRFGLKGARAALIACPRKALRPVLKEVIRDAPELPCSTVGGPWALDAPENRGSYLFNFTDLSEETVDEWIACAQAIGFNQIDFHGGRSFRFGDFHPDPETYPNGFASLKAVIDRLHAAGIKAGLHTYAFFIDKRCPWVTPVPDPRLAKDETLTLAQAIDAEATTIPVVEKTEHMSAVTGFQIRNSATLQIGDELIVYKSVQKKPPYAFLECERGACGTKVSAHTAGAPVHHLKQCFGLFAPGADTSLLTEVAAKTAEAYNKCGFDMIYLDALDGADVLAGRENNWHYGSKFVYEICKRLDRPAVMEMSTFYHHLWMVRSRMGAWDHPNRGHKDYIDMHCRANARLRRMFLPGQLGWWAVKNWTGIQNEPTFADDIEYLAAKALGTDTGLSLMGITPDSLRTNPSMQRYAGILKRYEALRHGGRVNEAIKERLAETGQAFTLVDQSDGSARFRPVHLEKHRVRGLDGWSDRWTTQNPHKAQPPRIRIEALMSARPYDSADSVPVVDFADCDVFTERRNAPEVTSALSSSTDQVKGGSASGRFIASNAGRDRRGAWAVAGMRFDPLLNLKGHEGLGVWIHGDGRGEVLNFQIRSPKETGDTGIGEHYVTVDFEGWRYYELIEIDGGRYADHDWPYRGAYAIYREDLDCSQINTLKIWYNNLAPDRTTRCYISPIKGLELVKATVVRPTITVGDQAITFPLEMRSGSFLECDAKGRAELFGPDGALIRSVNLAGAMPILEEGKNTVRFTCDGPTDVNPRVRVTIFTEGEPL